MTVNWLPPCSVQQLRTPCPRDGECLLFQGIPWLKRQSVSTGYKHHAPCAFYLPHSLPPASRSSALTSASVDPRPREAVVTVVTVDDIHLLGVCLTFTSRFVSGHCLRFVRWWNPLMMHFSEYTHNCPANLKKTMDVLSLGQLGR